MDFKTKLARRGKEEPNILVKGTIQQEEIIIINIYAPSTSVTNFIENTVRLKRSDKDHTLVPGHFNISLSQINQQDKISTKKLWN